MQSINKNILLQKKALGIKYLYFNNITKNTLKQQLCALNTSVIKPTSNNLVNNNTANKLPDNPAQLNNGNVNFNHTVNNNVTNAVIDSTINTATPNPDPNLIANNGVVQIQQSYNNFNYNQLKQATTLAQIKDLLNTFNACTLKDTAISTVFGQGDFLKKILVIGEAPGAEEDEQGIPFVGRSGIMLTTALQSVGIQRNDCFITNRVFWRPPGNRTPSELEIEQCYPFIKQIIAVLQPKLILLVGKVATTGILPNHPITKLIGRFNHALIDNVEYSVRAVYHPSYLLRSPSKKFILWQDVLQIADFLQSNK